jgi:DNA repair photolyase
MLRRQKGDMYEFVSHMWGPVRGRCKHDCSYCYMKKWSLPPLHIDERDIRTNLGRGNFIFVCHTIDLFADDVPTQWIKRVLKQLNTYPQNRYLLQSKNPRRFLEFVGEYPEDILFGTTIETNRTIYMESKAPPYIERAEALAKLHEKGFETMVTIEPIFDFDLDELVALVTKANPEWVNIGADSKGHNLPEPSMDKVRELIKALQQTTKIKLKRNLRRIYGQRR